MIELNELSKSNSQNTLVIKICWGDMSRFHTIGTDVIERVSEIRKRLVICFYLGKECWTLGICINEIP